MDRFSRKPNHQPHNSLGPKKGFCRFQDQSGRIHDLIHQTARISDSDPALRWQAQSAFLQILSHLHHSFPSRADDLRVIQPLATGPRKEQSHFQELVMNRLQNNLSSHFSVDELAHEFGMSRSALSHRFSFEIGETLTGLTNRLRMERAQELIGKSAQPIKEIAFEVGFEDPAYFSKKFRAATGVSPRRFRELFAPPQSDLIAPESRRARAPSDRHDRTSRPANENLNDRRRIMSKFISACFNSRRKLNSQRRFIVGGTLGQVGVRTKRAIEANFFSTGPSKRSQLVYWVSLPTTIVSMPPPPPCKTLSA